MPRSHLSKRKTMKKHYRPPGKKREGNAAKFITKTKAVRLLQTNLATFSHLCILKGVFPRVPKKKVEGNHKTYYYTKDILFLAHDPLLQTFRDIRAHSKEGKKLMVKHAGYEQKKIEITLLAFVNFKLYHSINVKYPPILDPRLEALAAELYALSRYIAAGSKVSLVGHQDSSSKLENSEMKSNVTKSEESELRLAQLQHQLPANEPGALMHLVEDASFEEEESKDTIECKALFKNLKFFLSREAPRESLLFIIPAFGGTVSWDGDGCPFKETDEDITHQIVDRDAKCHMYLSREYIQPQWVYDCVNARILIPTGDYLISRELPPHLSPFVDNEAEGYLPDYAKKIKHFQAAEGKGMLSLPGAENQDVDDPNNLLSEAVADRVKVNEAAEKKRRMSYLENQFLEELNKEMEGATYSAYLSDKKEVSREDAVLKGELHQNPELNVEKTSDMSKLMMSRRKRGLYEAIEIGQQRKKAQVNILKNRKKKAEAAKEQS